MTIYVSDAPWRSAEDDRFHLWADAPDEATLMVQIVGGAPFFPSATWPSHRLTLEQFDQAVACGAQLTDRWGPAYWVARQRGDHKMMRAIDTARTRGCA